MLLLILILSVISTLASFFIYPFIILYLQNLRAEKYINKKGKGKVCVITGGANGIGFETVKLFAKNEWRVFVLDINKQDLANLQTIANEKDWSVVTIVCDITDKESVESAVGTIQDEVSHVSCLINNAGITLPLPSLTLSYEEIQLQMGVNLLGPIYLTKLLRENLIVNKKPSIVINVASVAADAAFPWNGLYCSSKFGLEGFSNALRKEAFMSKLNLKVAIIKPGGVSTNLLIESSEKMMDSVGVDKTDPFFDGIKSVADSARDLKNSEKLLNYILNEPVDIAKAIYLAANEKNPQHVYHICRPLYYVLNLMKRLLPSKITDRLPN